jgi:DNA-binding CsgD family transcriptional regulator
MPEEISSTDTPNEQDAPAASEQTETVDRTTAKEESDPDSATVEIELPIEENALSAVEMLEDAFGTVTVRTVSDSGTVEEAPLLDTAPLTDKQLAALREAYYSGYFERPRECSATEIADSLGIAHSTFLRHLRAAQKNLFGEQFE